MSSIIEFLKQLGVYPFLSLVLELTVSLIVWLLLAPLLPGDYQQGQSLGCWSERAPSLAALL